MGGRQCERGMGPYRLVSSFGARLTRTETLARLRAAAPAVLPSMLLCDFGHLAEEVRRLEAAGAQALHLDVMDGHFVPNFTYGLPLVAAMRAATALPLDVHLMMSNPGQYLADFQRAGADVLTIHVEAAPDPRPLLAEIRRLGACAGLALNPPTPVDAVAPFLVDCDLLLAMSVMPGFGGQAFDPVALEKLRRLRDLALPLGGSAPLWEIDGGVNDKTIAECTAAGAELLVAGSAVLRQENYRVALEGLRALALTGQHRPAGALPNSRTGAL